MKETMNKEGVELADVLVPGLKQKQAEAEGVVVNGEKIAGVVLVMFNGNDYKLVYGKGSEQEIGEKFAEYWNERRLPIGLVRWESKQNGSKHELTTSQMPLGDPLPQHIGALEQVEQFVRSCFRPT
jgi:hypothetical protein